MIAPRIAHRLALLLGAVLGSGCHGTVDEPAGAWGAAQNAGGPAPANAGPDAAVPAWGASSDPCSGTSASAQLPPRLILLSDYQHLSSLRSLLGPTAIDPADAAENSVQTKPFSQKGVVVNGSVVHQRLAWAGGASESFAARFEELTGCVAATTDDACARSFLARFAARAFRRPVASEEVDDLMMVYATAKAESFSHGVKRAVEAALAAPSFMYRRELGEPGAPGTLTLTPHEFASELSFLLTDQPPDDELWRAVEDGAFGDEAGVAMQLDRLLAQRPVQDALSGTLISAWGLGNLFGTAKDPTLFPEYTPQLQAAMYHETELFVRDVLWDRQAPVGELLSARSSFANPALAAVYGLSVKGAADAYLPITLPADRAGILTQASVMATLARTDTTSVVARGLFVRGALLCLPKLPGPPESLATDIQNLLKADMTERQRAEVRAGNATCAGCHVGIDPFGLLLEEYDPLGKLRMSLAGAPIDASSEVNAGSITGTYKNALEFADAVAASPEFGACIGRHFLAYATQNESLSANDCAVAAVAPSSDELTMSSLVRAVALSPALRVRAQETP